jgi:hypothetical protein
MSLQTVLDLAGVKLIFKEKQLVLDQKGEFNVIRGEPRITLKALALCLSEVGAPCPPLTKYDLLAFGLKNSTDEEVTTYRTSEVEPVERTTTEAVAILEDGQEAMDGMTDCVIVSATGNKTVLSAIMSSLKRGKIDGNRLLLGQTATTLQVAKKIKGLFDKGVSERENCKEEEPAGATSWADDVEDDCGARETGAGPSDGSCERWIERYGRMDFNKLSKAEEDFFLKDWIASKAFSSGSQKKFFSDVPQTVSVEDWASKIYSLLLARGALLEEDEVDTAGLWAIRKYHGQLNVVGASGNRRVCRKN